MLDKEITFDRFVRGILIAASVIFLIYLTGYLSHVLLPFFVAWLLAYMLYPVVVFFHHTCRLRSRVVSIVLTLLLFISLITGLLYLTIPPLIVELIHLKNIILIFIEKGANNTTIPRAIETFISENLPKTELKQLLKEQDVIGIIRGGVSQLWNVVYETAGIIISMIASFITLIYLFFILFDYEKLADNWIKLVPKKQRPFVKALTDDVKQGMKSYFRGQSIIAFLVGVLFSVGFLIIDFPLAVGLGLLIGILNLVPYLQLVSFFPVTILALLKAADTGGNFWFILMQVLIVYIIVQLIQDLILTPKIMGKLMGMSPALILFSLSVWGYLVGFIGLIIALPLTNLLIAYYKRYVTKNE